MRLRHLRPRFSAVFRFEWAFWALLGALLTASLLALPRLELRFEFTDVLAEDHPARRAVEEYEEDFGLGPRFFVYLHGEAAFSSAFLLDLERLSAQLERLPGTRGVRSAIDLREPVTRGRALRVQRILDTALLRDPARLRERLRAPPFTTRWRGLLYDAALETLVLVVDPRVEGDDPRSLVEYVAAVRRLVEPVADRHGLEVHPHGVFFLNEESFRVTAESQARTTTLSVVIQTFLLWLLFGSLWLSLQVTLLLNVSILLGLGAMAAAGIPLNFLSGNFPVMLMVIGVADIVHILGAYSRDLERYAPRTAALRAMRETFWPNLFTTLTTLGCIVFTTYTDLAILRWFCLSLCLGIGIVWAVTIVYGPLLFMRSGMRPGRGGLYGLRTRLRVLLRERWLPVLRRPATLGLFAALFLAAGWLTARQTINSNWFRSFSARSPVSRTVAFLEREHLPVSVADVTVAAEGHLDELFTDPRFGRDVALLEEALRGIPGVLGVDSLFEHKRMIDEIWPTLPFPEDLAPVWREARRASVYRQYLAGGLFDDYWSARAGRLRLVLATELEDSLSFLRLRDAVLARARALELEVLDPATVEMPGQMLYWTVIIDSIGRTFFASLAGSLGVILVCFLLLTRSPTRAALAMLPNVLPILMVFAVAECMGQDLREDFCFLVSLTIGIAVDDTLHFLYHYGRARDRGGTAEGGVRHAFDRAGAPIVVTSGILMVGFATTLEADVLPMLLTGVFVNVSVGTALGADLWLLPALLLRFDRGPRARGGAG